MCASRKKLLPCTCFLNQPYQVSLNQVIVMRRRRGRQNGEEAPENGRRRRGSEGSVFDVLRATGLMNAFYFFLAFVVVHLLFTLVLWYFVYVIYLNVKEMLDPTTPVNHTISEVIT